MGGFAVIDGSISDVLDSMGEESSQMTSNILWVYVFFPMISLCLVAGALMVGALAGYLLSKLEQRFQLEPGCDLPSDATKHHLALLTRCTLTRNALEADVVLT